MDSPSNRMRKCSDKLEPHWCVDLSGSCCPVTIPRMYLGRRFIPSRRRRNDIPSYVKVSEGEKAYIIYFEINRNIWQLFHGWQSHPGVSQAILFSVIACYFVLLGPITQWWRNLYQRRPITKWWGVGLKCERQKACYGDARWLSEGNKFCGDKKESITH